MGMDEQSYTGEHTCGAVSSFFYKTTRAGGTGVGVARCRPSLMPHGWSHETGTGKPRPLRGSCATPCPRSRAHPGPVRGPRVPRPPRGVPQRGHGEARRDVQARRELGRQALQSIMQSSNRFCRSIMSRGCLWRSWCGTYQGGREGAAGEEDLEELLPAYRAAAAMRCRHETLRRLGAVSPRYCLFSVARLASPIVNWQDLNPWLYQVR
jgi:hypothetical protein